MSIASEITRLQGVKSDILQAISDKGVEVPAGSALDDCPGLIASISGGGGGGSIINKNYETDFSEFDVYNKYDIPKEGYLTSYPRIATYQKENGKLKIIAPPGNLDFDFFNPLFFIKKNSVLNLYDVELERTSDYNFLWLDLYSSSALTCHNSLSDNELIFLINASSKYTTTMNLLHGDSAYKWFDTSFSLLQSNNIRVEYDEFETRYYVNDTLIITTNQSVYNKVNGISINPRGNKYIKISGIKFKQ